MFKRIFAAALMGLMLTGTLAKADPIPIADLSAYLNRMQTATAPFRQIAANGAVDTGTFYVQRPYRMRFEYDTQPLLVLASAGQVAIFDGKSNAGPEQYPMSRTPLSLILAPTVDLSKQGTIVAHGQVNADTIVTIRDPSGRTPGTIEMVFAPGPVLKHWVATDEYGDRTTVILENLRMNVEFRPSTFAIQSEIQRRKQ